MCSLRDEEFDVFFTDVKYPSGLKALTDVKIQVGAPTVASKTLARRCTHGPVGHGLARASMRQASHSRKPAQSSRLSQRWPLDASGRAVICLPCQRAHQKRSYFCVYPLIPVRLVFILVVFGLQLVVIWSSYRSSSRCPIKLPIKACATMPLGVQRILPKPLFSSVPSGSRDSVCSQAEVLSSSGRRSGSGRGPSESLTRVADSQTGRRGKVLLRKTAGQEASSFVLGGLSAFFLFPTLKFLKSRWLLSAGTPDGGNRYLPSAAGHVVVCVPLRAAPNSRWRRRVLVLWADTPTLPQTNARTTR